jgi:hypothetical protein
MWAIVDGNDVVEILKRPKAVTINNIQHPSAIFKLWTAQELKAINVYQYVEIGKDIYEELFKVESDSTFVNHVLGVVEKTYTKTNKDFDDTFSTAVETGEVTLIAKGLKTTWLELTKQKQANRLRPTDWAYTRKVDTGQAVPQEIQQYRDAVRLAATTIENSIKECTTFEEFYKLFQIPSGSVNAPITDWPEEL